MNRTKNHFPKGFSLVELLVVIAIIGVIAGAGFVVTTTFVGTSKLSNEYTHLIQLVKKYYKKSNAQSEPMYMYFTADEANFLTKADVIKFSDDDYSRFSIDTDCEGLINSSTYQNATNSIQPDDYNFKGMRILVCAQEGSDLTYEGICFNGKNELAETVKLYIHSMSDSPLLCDDIETALKNDFRRLLTVYKTGYVEDERNF